MRHLRPVVGITVVLVALALVACSGTSSSLGRYFQGRTLVVNVVTIDRLPELRYSTIDTEDVVRRYRLTPSEEDLELVLVRMKVENHTAVSAIVNIDERGAELRDFLRGTYFPVDVGARVLQDLRGEPTATVRMDQGQCFDPNRMVITRGTTVNWVNEGSVVHFVTLGQDGAAEGSGERSQISPGESFSHTFNDPGTFDYQCGAEGLPVQAAQILVQGDGEQSGGEERSMLFLVGPFELQRGTGIDGWMVFEAPKGTKFRDLRWRAGDSITITF